MQQHLEDVLDKVIADTQSRQKDGDIRQTESGKNAPPALPLS